MLLNYRQVLVKEDATPYKELVAKAIDQSPWSNMGTIDNGHIELLAKLYLEHPSPDTRGLFVCYDGPVLVGLLAAIINKNIVIENQANELMWYVLPDYQGMGVGNELIKMYEDWARSHNIRLVTMSHYSNDIGNALSKLYSKSGYKQIEATYVKELN